MERKVLDAVTRPIPSQSPSAPDAALAGSRVGVQEELLLGPLRTDAVAIAPFWGAFVPCPPLLDIRTAAAISGFDAAADEASAASSGHNIYWVLPRLLRRLISAL